MACDLVAKACSLLHSLSYPSTSLLDSQLVLSLA